MLSWRANVFGGNFENRLRFDKVAESLKMGTFLRHSVYVCLSVCFRCDNF